MNAPLSKKLNEVKWGEFKIGDLFEKQNLKFKKGKFDKEKDVSRILTEEYSLPLVNAKDGDNGIMYYGRPEDFENVEMSIDIVNDGAVSTGNVYSQPQKTGVLYNAYLIKSKFELNSSQLHFFTTTIQKSIKLKFSYELKASWERVKEEFIQLPEKNDGNIDFDFMEAFIRELEEERIRELEEERIRELAAYLKVSGFDNYKLSKCESFALAHFNELKWKEFNLENLYGKSTRGKRLKSADRIKGDLPFVTAGEADTGISAYIGNEVEIFSKNTTTIDMFGSAKYRNYDYGADDHVAVVHTEKLPKHAAVFVTAAVHKASHTGKFDYSNNFYASDADELNIMLPVNSDDSPDYAFMETFISAVQKLVIKDVVLYADKKIAATKQVVHKNPSDYKTPEGFGTLEVAEHN